MIEKAVILAAGKGERMGHLTKATPKSLLKVAGKPLMQYMIELLAAHGIKQIAVNVCHLGDQIKAYFGDGATWGVQIKYVEEPVASGTAGGVVAIAKQFKFDSDFMVVASDMLVNFDLAAMMKAHLANSALGTMACYFRDIQHLKKSGVVLFKPDDFKVLDFVERPQHESQIISQWVNSSVYCFSPQIIDILNAKKNQDILDIPRDLFPELIALEKLYAFPFSEKFYQLGVDSPDRLNIAENDIRSGKFYPTL